MAEATTVGPTDLKFRLAREDFADAVAWVAKNLPSRPTAPVLAGVLLTGSDEGLTISGFDYEVSSEVQVAAEIASPGIALVSGRLLSDITRALPAKPVEVSVDGTRVSLTCGSARFSLPTMAVEDYPTLPTLPEETGVVSADLFGEAIGQVAVAAGRDDTLPMLTGIRVEIDGESVVLAATDRFRLAVRELKWSTTSADMQAAVLVPAKTLAEAAKTGAVGTDVHLALGAGAAVGKEGLLGIRSDGKRSTTRLLDAEFPKFRQLLPVEHTAMATIGVVELSEAIKRVALVADRGAQIRMEFNDNGLRLSASADNVGRAEEDLQVDFAGEPLTIAFNPTYLTDGLGSLHSDKVSFGFTQPSRPAVLRPVTGDGTDVPEGSGSFPALETDYVYLLMPVRLPAITPPPQRSASMQLGLIGLGKMGFNMRERLRSGGHEVVGYDPRPEVSDVESLAGLAQALTAPRVVWVMVPSGPITDETIVSLAGELSAGDLVIDGGNSRFTEDAPHAKLLQEKGIAFIDAGVSGGIWGLKEGYGLMVGGRDEDVAQAMPIFDTLRPPGDSADGFVHAGPVGAGHYAKMVHNGIEYGLMTAYAEGYELLAAEPLIADVQAIIQAWTNGTVVRSWLQQLLAKALKEDPDFADISGYTEDSGEGRWTVEEAINHRVPTPVIAASLFARFASRQDDSPTMKAVSALRNQFGGHAVQRVPLSG